MSHSRAFRSNGCKRRRGNGLISKGFTHEGLLGNGKAFALFVSPFTISLASMVSAGEFISQLERKNKPGRPMRWGKIFWTFGLAMGMLVAVGAMMMLWC